LTSTKVEILLVNKRNSYINIKQLREEYKGPGSRRTSGRETVFYEEGVM
jgi:hypothetical protein